jgi:hypothetical protein
VSFSPLRKKPKPQGNATFLITAKKIKEHSSIGRKRRKTSLFFEQY